MNLAKETIIAAAEAGADSVKFQNYVTEDFISNRELMIEYRSQGKNMRESQYDLFKRNEISREELIFLKDICDTCGVMFHSTPTNEKGVKDLQDIGCSVIKNGSDYLTIRPPQEQWERQDLKQYSRQAWQQLQRLTWQ